MSSNTFIEKHETYPKQTLRNRYYIATSQGIQCLSIPVIKTQGNNTPIDKIIISSATDFKRNHFRAINTAYKSAPFFDYYIDFFYECLYYKEDLLIEYNTFILKKICQILSINKDINFTTEFKKKLLSQIDLRQNISNKNAVGEYSNIHDIGCYYQIFEDKIGFIKNLSILDLIFHEGPNAKNIIKSVK